MQPQPLLEPARFHGTAVGPSDGPPHQPVDPVRVQGRQPGLAAKAAQTQLAEAYFRRQAVARP